LLLTKDWLKFMYVPSTLSLCQLNIPVHLKTYSTLRIHSTIYIPSVIIFETENIKKYCAVSISFSTENFNYYFMRKSTCILVGLKQNSLHIAHLRQECQNSKSVIFQEKLLKFLKCYNFLWVQQWHNCSPAVSFANCVMTLYLLKVHLQTFLSIPITQKCLNFELWHSCRKLAICIVAKHVLNKTGGVKSNEYLEYNTLFW
jgi:hypothetical protein